jgi:hypothetical protein
LFIFWFTILILAGSIVFMVVRLVNKHKPFKTPVMPPDEDEDEDDDTVDSKDPIDNH